MEINLKEISVGELTDGFKNNKEDGVVGFGGKLDIRPPYQREFIYKDKQRDAVIDTLIKGFPLNVMYWATKENGEFEIIDGQQRTLSICQYRMGDFSFNSNNSDKSRYFGNQPNDIQQQILNYKLMVYQCSGPDSEKLGWFKTINIAGEELTDQELRNAVYSGSWVTEAKRHFSKTRGPASSISGKYLTGSPIRQDYLETAIRWLSEGNIEDYMAKNQHQPNANELWLYFQKVINWVKAIFPNYRTEMKGIPWGSLYNEFGDKKWDADDIEIQVKRLMQDEDVTKKKGIYSYMLEGKEKHLNIRSFSANQKREAYEKQDGICLICDEKFKEEEMDADHITPWHKGGKTINDNCRMLCKADNRSLGG